MRKFILSATLFAICASPASAISNSSFEESITLPAGQSVKINVSLSEDLAHRAENLPKALRDRSGARGQRDGFKGNGHYGTRDLDRLQTKMAEKLSKDFAEQGITVSDNASYTFNIVIEDARPSRPTQRQLSMQPGLSMQSLALGGAEIAATLTDTSGNALGEASYGWYENDLRHSFAILPWQDAERAISRFSSRTAKSFQD